MLESELAKESEVFYNALVTSRATSALSNLRQGAQLSEADERSLQECLQLLVRVQTAQSLVDREHSRFAPDVASMRVYQYMREAAIARRLLLEDETVGRAAARFAATINAILAGKSHQEIGGEEYSQLVNALEALASAYASKTIVSTSPKESYPVLEWSLQ
jgi:hypothetical protein